MNLEALVVVCQGCSRAVEPNSGLVPENPPAVQPCKLKPTAWQNTLCRDEITPRSKTFRKG